MACQPDEADPPIRDTKYAIRNSQSDLLLRIAYRVFQISVVTALAAAATRECLTPMRRARRALRIPLLALAILLGYVSSVGPASVLADRYPILRDYLTFYYAPLNPAAQYPSLGWPLRHYENWWRKTFR